MNFFFTIFLHLSSYCMVVHGGDALRYWSLKPYIFNTTSGRLDGIFIRLMELYLIQCDPTATPVQDRMDVRSKTYSEFLTEMNTSSYESLYSWYFPVLTDQSLSYNYKNYRPMVYFKASGAMIIIRRDEIRAGRKLWIGLAETSQFLLMSIMLALIFGTVIWLLEKTSNEDFSTPFPIGILHAFWFGIVSMTTVGYGDMTPRCFIARLFCMIWLIFALMLSAIITAQITDSLSGSSYLDVEGKTVAVLKNSEEVQIAQQYDAITVARENYDDVLNAVRVGDAYAAIINADVVSWLQTEIRHGHTQTHEALSIVYKIDYEIPITAIEPRTSQMDENISTCWKENINQILEASYKPFLKHVKLENIHYSTFSEFFTNPSEIGFILLITCLAILLIAVADEVIRRMVHRDKDKMNITEETIEMKRNTSIAHSNLKLNMLTEINKLNTSINKLELDVQDIKEMLGRSAKQTSRTRHGYDNVMYTMS